MRGARTYGILSPFVGGDYYGAVIAGANAAAVAGGDRVIAVQTLNPGAHSADHSGVPDFRHPVAWQHLAGLIMLPGAADLGYARRAREAGKPVVLIGQVEVAAGFSTVLADGRSGVREAVSHLIGHGHQRIAFAGHLAHFDVRERHEGYREAMRQHGLDAGGDLLFDTGDNHESGGVEVAGALLQAGMPVTAVVLGTDRNAVGLIGRLASAGVDVPGGLAVVGFDDIADAAYLRPSLSTVRQPLQQVGAAAYAVASELRERPDQPPIVRQVRTEFVRRRSCGCPAGGLPVTEEANRELFAEVQYLQETLNIQYALGIELLGTHAHEPRELTWLGRTPAIGGCLALWPDKEPDRTPPAGADPVLEIVGEFRAAGPARESGVGSILPVSGFPPPSLFELADGPAGDIVFVVPVRDAARDWGVLAAVGRIQTTTPPGREMMNQSGALLTAALGYGAMMAELREKEEGLRNAALHDPLTGLPNRALLADRLEQAGLRAARRADHRFALLLIDLDGFKDVNDSLGHAAGDQLLVEVARRLTGRLRRSDTVARLGGDEFVVLLDGIGYPGREDTVCEAIRAAVTEAYVLDGHRVEVGVSIGVAVSSAGCTDPDLLLREADAAMYRVKSANRRR